jgi:hypothetical protein
MQLLLARNLLALGLEVTKNNFIIDRNCGRTFCLILRTFSYEGCMQEIVLVVHVKEVLRGSQ